jgi:hypothetical protein
MMTSPHWTECFGVCHGPQFVPHAVADEPLLPSLPVGDKKYVCSAANGVPAGAELDDATGDGVGVGLATDVDVGAGVGVGPLLDGVLLPPPQDASRIAHASGAILAAAIRPRPSVKVKGQQFAPARPSYLAARDGMPSSVMRACARTRAIA